MRPLPALCLLLAAATVGCGQAAGPGEVIQTDRIVRPDQPPDPSAAARSRRQRIERDRRAARRAASRTLDGLGSLAAQLDAEVGVSIRAPGGSREYAQAGSLQSGSAWSTIKVPIALRLLDDVGGPTGLSERQHADIAAAISQSDNAAAARLFADLAREHGGDAGAAAAVGTELARAGDEATTVSTVGRDGFSSYGQTEWSLDAQGRFMAALLAGCLGDPASRRLLLAQMHSVTSDRWGLGAIDLPALWKGGWGPGVDGRYLVRQMGAIEAPAGPIVVTLAARSADGSFEASTADASAVARWLADRVRRLSLPARPCG